MITNYVEWLYSQAECHEKVAQEARLRAEIVPRLGQLSLFEPPEQPGAIIYQFPVLNTFGGAA